jgi:hypothetical protein
MTDGVAPLVANLLPVSGDDRPEPVVEGWLPYRGVFDLLWSGRRHVMMGATQIDRYGNQNIACIGDHAAPRAIPSTTPPATGWGTTARRSSSRRSTW